ncbi:MAG: zinc-ribbon domain-containing protein, partial [Clostridia bacterium]|nr:zinc-ribbon domain-containing protein [Clostridia bacterium]
QACGTVNNLDACFCKNCGVKLEVVDVEVEPAEEKKCCCGHHEGEEHECCCGHHEGEEHECCCHAEADEEETVIEIAQNKICPNCQAENDPEHTFCNKCGAKL